MVLQITATGGRASSQLQALRNACWVEYWDDADQPNAPDRIRITAAGKKALATKAQEPITYRRGGEEVA